MSFLHKLLKLTWIGAIGFIFAILYLQLRYNNYTSDEYQYIPLSIMFFVIIFFITSIFYTLALYFFKIKPAESRTKFYLKTFLNTLLIPIGFVLIVDIINITLLTLLQHELNSTIEKIFIFILKIIFFLIYAHILLKKYQAKNYFKIFNINKVYLVIASAFILFIILELL